MLENNICSICKKLGTSLAPANISKKTGERLYRTWCTACEKERKDIWRAENTEKHNARNRVWNKENPDKRKASSKKYELANKEFTQEIRRLWKQENKFKVNLSTQLRRRKLKMATPKCVNEWDQLFFAEIYDIAQRRNLEVDHIIPLIHSLVCGLHVPENLQLLTKSENSSKGNTWTLQD